MPVYTALLFLTRFPQFLKTPITEKDLQRSVCFFPLIGAFIGGILYAIFFALKGLLEESFLCALILTAETVITGGIHLDGLADTSDGIFSGKEREKKLEIMKDSRVGAFGVIAIVLDFLLKFSGILSILKENPLLLIIVPVAGKWLISFGIVFFPYLREKGLGKAFNCGKGRIRFFISSFICVIICGIILKLKVFYFLTALIFSGLIFSFYIMKELKGMTGDTYGALNEFGEIFSLLILMLLYK
ncbi:adenosylcobinamide-GDP ribazoletransferase [Thermovenabulum sp.]|uniref:adenosylcobinamide-GDP ribazoletransferase n=1 Tax=Thermovenabulum sp. TaxID=3100335 RepID=UPI003C7984E1